MRYVPLLLFYLSVYDHSHERRSIPQVGAFNRRVAMNYLDRQAAQIHVSLFSNSSHCPPYTSELETRIHQLSKIGRKLATRTHSERSSTSMLISLCRPVQTFLSIAGIRWTQHRADLFFFTVRYPASAVPIVKCKLLSTHPMYLPKTLQLAHSLRKGPVLSFSKIS